MLARATFFAAASLVCGILFSASPAQAQTAYGVNNQGLLFSFDVTNPAVVTPIGNVGFVPEGIDFRTSTRSLYAIDIGTGNSQVYTLNLTTGAATPVGASFPSVVAGSYNLTTAASFGFDFNPTTTQGDGSMRIRLVGDNGTNLRLNSSTGQVAAVDLPLAFAAGDANTGTPNVSASAYINNRVIAGGTTTLFNVDSRVDALLTQNPPNNGTLNTIGNLGVTVDVQPGGGFDVFTDPLSTDATVGGDTAYGVFQRLGVSGGAYLLYNVNLTTGQLTNGALVGGGADFTGGFAVVPEPSTIVLGSMGLVALLAFARRRRTAQAK